MTMDRQVLLTFLEYRGRCEMGRKEWQSVLDDNFEMRMPITPYRSFPPQQVRQGRVVMSLFWPLPLSAACCRFVTYFIDFCVKSWF